MAFKNGSCHICDLLNRNSALQCLCDLEDRVFTHSIRDQICAGINQYAVLNLIFPVIIMSQSAKTRLNSAENDRCMLINLTNQITVNYTGPIWS